MGPKGLVRSLRAGPPSALLVPVAEAAGLPVTAGPGALPPHVTVLYPFVGARRIDAALIASLQEVLGRFGPFSFTLTRTGRFPGVLYAAPEPPEPFVALTMACVERWPEHPPFRGAFEDVVPHLTVSTGAEDGDRERFVAARLPLVARASRVWLMAPRTSGGAWRRLASIELAGA